MIATPHLKLVEKVSAQHALLLLTFIKAWKDYGHLNEEYCVKLESKDLLTIKERHWCGHLHQTFYQFHKFN